MKFLIQCVLYILDITFFLFHVCTRQFMSYKFFFLHCHIPCMSSESDDNVYHRVYFLKHWSDYLFYMIVYVDWQITGQAGIQWKLLLESRTSELFKIDLEVSDLGYDQIDGRHLPVISITAVTGVFLIMSKTIKAYLHVTRSTDIILSLINKIQRNSTA